MTLLNLIIISITFILSIENFLKCEIINGLVFIKPESLTKTELVEKFKELSSSKSLKNLKNENEKKEENKISKKEKLKSYYSKLLPYLSKFKNFLIKIGLFTILIKYFRKFKIMRFILRIVNYILLSTFGIFINDIYGIKEILTSIEYYWMEYVNFIHDSRIYKTFVKIFRVINDEDKIIEVKSEVIENKYDSKIDDSELPSSWGELKKEKNVYDKYIEENEKGKWNKLNEYYWIVFPILSLTLIYIYWDSIIELFKNVKPDNNGDTINDSPNLLTYKEEYEQYFKEINTNEELYDLDVIKSQNKSKIIDYIDVENTKWEDSSITPKATTSKLPETQGIMVPISKK
uniref:Uncharacterized protein n=1 Tax=Russula griseocarnosa TaxID=466936 RepID=A0A650AWI5_9AGAM|nr:hypothetical protein [Russula griseocarnosa]